MRLEYRNWLLYFLPKTQQVEQVCLTKAILRFKAVEGRKWNLFFVVIINAMRMTFISRIIKFIKRFKNAVMKKHKLIRRKTNVLLNALPINFFTAFLILFLWAIYKLLQTIIIAFPIGLVIYFISSWLIKTLGEGPTILIWFLTICAIEFFWPPRHNKYREP